jgi:hypothetical protein
LTNLPVGVHNPKIDLQQLAILKSDLDCSRSEFQREHPLGRDTDASACKDSRPYSVGRSKPETAATV